jgi:hypothetical protein
MGDMMNNKTGRYRKELLDPNGDKWPIMVSRGYYLIAEKEAAEVHLNQTRPGSLSETMAAAHHVNIMQQIDNHQQAVADYWITNQKSATPTAAEEPS